MQGVVDHRVLVLPIGKLGGSALTDRRIDIPAYPGDGIPVTYVPARNTVFLACALSYAEVIGARDIYIGVNAVDYSGYPDCRPEFIAAFERLASLATKAGVEGAKILINAPLIDMTKAEIIRRGAALGVDYSITVSCYQPDIDARACGRCDSCRLRRAGFEQAGIADPTRYR
jgi:7-cyano-7-deazaguanine synthase